MEWRKGGGPDCLLIPGLAESVLGCEDQATKTITVPLRYTRDQFQNESGSESRLVS
jgi:hypothetical protein